MYFPYSFWVEQTPYADAFGVSGLLSGLLAYYKFEGNGNDSSSNNYHQTGASSWHSGKIGSGYSGTATGFLSNNSYGSKFSLSGAETTFSFWFYYNQAAANQSYGVMLAKNFPEIEASGLGEYAIYNTSNQVTWNVVNLAILSYSTLVDNSWNHIVAWVKNSGIGGSEINLLINNEWENVANSSTSEDVLPITDYFQFTIGHGNTPSYANTSGVIDELGIWQRGLTSGEIDQLWNAGNGLTYPFG